MQSMERLVDDPSNGIMLEPNVHTVFDKLKVYLEQKPEVSLQDCSCYIASC
jgi:HNH endonuclease